MDSISEKNNLYIFYKRMLLFSNRGGFLSDMLQQQQHKQANRSSNKMKCFFLSLVVASFLSLFLLLFEGGSGRRGDVLRGGPLLWRNQGLLFRGCVEGWLLVVEVLVERWVVGLQLVFFGLNSAVEGERALGSPFNIGAVLFVTNQEVSEVKSGLGERGRSDLRKTSQEAKDRGLGDWDSLEVLHFLCSLWCCNNTVVLDLFCLVLLYCVRCTKFS